MFFTRHSYPKASDVVRQAKKAAEEKEQKDRERHYDFVFGLILAAANEGYESILMDAYRVESFGLREYLESLGYRVEKLPPPVNKPPQFLRLGVSRKAYRICWGGQKENVNETL